MKREEEKRRVKKRKKKRLKREKLITIIIIYFVAYWTLKENSLGQKRAQDKSKKKTRRYGELMQRRHGFRGGKTNQPNNAI